MTELVLPQHSNAIGTAFGGTILAWMDVCAAITAQRHCGRVAVTAAIDQVKFLAPIRVGDVVVLSGRVNAVFNTSMEIELEVLVEDCQSGNRTPCLDAFMTFVALEDGKPVPVPPLLCESTDDERRSREARERRERRLQRG